MKMPSANTRPRLAMSRMNQLLMTCAIALWLFMTNAAERGAHEEGREHPHEGRGQEPFPNGGRATDLDATRERVGCRTGRLAGDRLWLTVLVRPVGVVVQHRWYPFRAATQPGWSAIQSTGGPQDSSMTFAGSPCGTTRAHRGCVDQCSAARNQSRSRVWICRSSSHDHCWSPSPSRTMIVGLRSRGKEK